MTMLARTALLGVLISACGDRSEPAAPPATPTLAPPDASAAIARPRDLEPVTELQDVFTGMIHVPEGKWVTKLASPARDHLGTHWPARPASVYNFSYPFYVDRTEVTVAEYRACVEKGACREPRLSAEFKNTWKDDAACTRETGNWWLPGRDDHPVTCILLPDAHAYCLHLGKRLLWSTEWQYAARGPNHWIYPWGNKLPTCKTLVFWSESKPACTPSSTRPVGTTKLDVSPFGVMDLAGNVSEYAIEDERAYETMHYIDTYSTFGGGITSPTIEIDKHERHKFVNPGVGFRCAYSEKSFWPYGR